MTKIIATLGPACQSVEAMKALIHAGMDGARVNFSHGDHKSHKVTIDNLKQAREELDAPIPLILDTKGPEIRTGKIKDGEIMLKKGDRFTLTSEEVVGDQRMVSVSYKHLMKDVYEGAKVMIDDGLIELKVLSLTDRDVLCEVINGGPLSANKGVNLPNMSVKLPVLTDKDVSDILFGIEQGFDFIAASFVQSAEDIELIRKILNENGGSHIRIIAKIENRAGLDQLDEILKASDGIMVARGDLGVEIPQQEVPIAQKHMIKKANRLGKVVITATQMLESMTQNPRPTRAEASDVANAVFDGTDVVMLSGETAKGHYPIESVKMMADIVQTAEQDEHYNQLFHKGRTYADIEHDSDPVGITNAISYATCMTADELNAKCIVNVTNSGFTTRNVSRFKPGCPILAVTLREVIWRQLNLVWGAYPIQCSLETEGDIHNAETVFAIADKMAKFSGLAEFGDTIVVVAGVPVGVAGTTNTMKVQIVGDSVAN